MWFDQVHSILQRVTFIGASTLGLVELFPGDKNIHSNPCAMPRPKNTKGAPIDATIGTSRPTTSRKTEQQLELASAASNRDGTGSDDSEGLVKTQRNRIIRKSTTAQDVMMMSGALAPKDAGEARVKPLTGRKRAVLSRIVRNADHDKAIEALKARRDAALAAEKGIEIQVPSSIPAEPLLATEPVAEQVERISDPVSVVVAKTSSVPATPRVGVASAFRGSNFKRRPRQPSLLQLVQAQANPQSEDDDDDLDDFHPDDESTPFVQAKSQLLPQPSLSSSDSSVNQSSSRKRKLSSPVVQVERSPSPETRISSLGNPSDTPDSDIQEEDEEDGYNLPFPAKNHDDHPQPSLPVPKSPQASQSIQWSDTCAPPQSSSPIRHEISKPLIQRGRPKRKSPSVSSPVSRPLKPLSTATLQNLLPRRRVRPASREHDPFNLPSSSDVEIDTSRLSAEADELSVPAKPRVRTKKQTKDLLVKTPATKKKKSHGAASRKDDGKSAWAPKPPKKTPQLKKPKTYARTEPVISNKPDENENASGSDDDDNNPEDHHPSSHPPVEPLPVSTELQRLARKFREVDRWELEVEDVTPSSGSQRDAR